MERRTIAFDTVEIREEGSGRTFVGYASVFNSPTQIGSFREKVSPTAFDRALGNGQDVRMLWNHNTDVPLGRTGKNVKLSVDERGLKVEAELPNTTAANDLIELTRSGIVGQMSFGFSTKGISGADSWTRGEDGVAERTLNDVDLFDVSPTTFAAYGDTTAEVRAQAEEIEKRDPEDVVDTPIDQDVAETLLATIRTALQALAQMMDVENNSADPADETRAGKVLSDANAQHVSAAMDHLQQVIDAANNQDTDEDADVDDESMIGYNSVELLSEKRGRLLAMLEAGVDVTDELREIAEVVDYASRAISQADRDAAAKSGAAMPDGSFPITNEQQLKAAIHLNGHSKTYSQQQIRDHIKARAKALGLMSLIPDSWS